MYPYHLPRMAFDMWGNPTLVDIASLRNFCNKKTAYKNELITQKGPRFSADVVPDMNMDDAARKIGLRNFGTHRNAQYHLPRK